MVAVVDGQGVLHLTSSSNTTAKQQHGNTTAGLVTLTGAPVMFDPLGTSTTSTSPARKQRHTKTNGKFNTNISAAL
jgi:hypothetical protein